MRRVTILTLAAWLLLAFPAGAAESDASGGAPGMAASAWGAVVAAMNQGWTAVTSRFGTPDPFGYLPEQLPPRDQSFLALMDAAGYRLAQVDTAGSLLARVRYRFVQERAASP